MRRKILLLDFGLLFCCNGQTEGKIHISANPAHNIANQLQDNPKKKQAMLIGIGKTNPEVPMYITLIRAVIIYLLIMCMVRLMGKRQIGELQPSELIITILLSELVAIPMQDNNLPLFNSIIPVLVLVSIEIIISVISMKSRRFRSVMQGNSVVVIRDGVIDQNEVRQLRFTVDDLLSSLRQKDVFDLSQVQYAILETNGKLSVLLKPEYQTATPRVLDLQVQNEGMPYLVISDGRIIGDSLKESKLSLKRLKAILKAQRVEQKDVFILTVDQNENVTLVKKEETS